MEIIKNPEQIKFKIQDIDGNEYEMEVKSITRKIMREFYELIENEKKEKKEKNEDNQNKDVYDFLVRQLCLFTGKEELFFDNFHLTVLASAVTYVTQELQRPFQQMQQSESS